MTTNWLWGAVLSTERKASFSRVLVSMLVVNPVILVSFPA